MKDSPDDIDQFAFDPNQTIVWNPNLTISNQLYLGQSNPNFKQNNELIFCFKFLNKFSFNFSSFVSIVSEQSLKFQTHSASS